MRILSFQVELIVSLDKTEYRYLLKDDSVASI